MNVLILLPVFLLCSAGPAASQEGCQRVNMAFLIDSSGSAVSDSGIWGTIQSFVTRIIGRLDVSQADSWVAVVQYATEPEVIFSFTDYYNKSDMYTAIENAQPLATNTNTNLGLRAVLDQFDGVKATRPGVRNVTVVVTDGRSNLDAHLTIPAANALRQAGIDIFVVGIGITLQPDFDELQGIAGSSQNFVRVRDFDSLLNSVDNIVGLQCVPKPTDIAFPGYTVSTAPIGTQISNSSTGPISSTAHVHPVDPTTSSGVLLRTAPSIQGVAMAILIIQGLKLFL